MGKVFKKKAASSGASENKKKNLKRKIEEPEEVNEPVIPEPEEEEDPVQASDEEVESGAEEDELDDEELEDEEEDDDDDDEEGESKNLMNDASSEKAEFDFEAFPLEQQDKDGLINMLTQIFLRTDVDVGGLADEMIRIAPIGNVVGPAEDQADEDSENVVYGVVTAVDLNLKKEEPVKYAQSVVDFLLQKANKYASKNIIDAFNELKTIRSGLLINERMLHFPNQIVTPCFNSLSVDLAGMKTPYKKVVYIQKLRVCDAEESNGPKNTVPMRKKKKLGKAAKKRLAAESLAQKQVTFDNVEDADLYELSTGSLVSFDYPVHNDVEADSKFHIVEKDKKKYLPYRRATIMDAARFDAFVKRVASTHYE